jgi:CPA2 family monovalent cation:H+ antiporter-2
MVLGESDFRHQIEDDIRPFRDLLIGLFFITVGLQLDGGHLIRSPGDVLLWLALLVPAKLLLNRFAMRLSGLGRMDAWRSAIVLAHGGEFGLMLVASALGSGVIPPEQGQPTLVALVLSMAAAPLLIRHHDRLAATLFGRRGPSPMPQEEEAESRRMTKDMRRHVIICGAGHLGCLVARALELAEVSHLLVESDYEAFRAARDAGLPVLYGDAGRAATLKGAHVAEAKMVIITFHRATPATRIARWLRHEYPHMPVVATSLTEHDARQLLAIPGLRVYAEKHAAGLALAEQALLEIGMSAEAADGLISQLRLDLQPQSARTLHNERS